MTFGKTPKETMMTDEPAVPTLVNVSMPTQTEYVTLTVHEHRAPTDASVALLKEMEAAALAKIEQSINVGGNGFECVVRVEQEALSMDTVAVAIAKLNGKPLRATARVCGWQQRDPSELAIKLRDELAKAVASEIIGPALAAAWRTQ